MKWILRSILALWVTALVLVGLYFVIDWDRLEQKRVTERIHDLIEEQSAELYQLKQDYSKGIKQPPTSSKFLYRIFANGELVIWSDNKVLPSYGQLKESDSVYFLEDAGGKYVVQHLTIEKTGEITDLFSVLRLQENFQILNNLLKDIINPLVFSQNPKEISNESDYPITYKGQLLFKIIPSGLAKSWLLSISIWAVLFSLPLSILYGLRRLKKKLERRYLISAVAFLVFFRLLLLVLEFPGRWLDSNIFDEELYSSSLFAMTLGDVLLSVLFMVVIAVLVNNWMSSVKKVDGAILRIGGLLGAIFLIYLNIDVFYLICRDLMEHSQISFDLTESIRFDFPRIIAFAVIIFSAVLYFISNHILANWINRLDASGGAYLLVHILMLVVFINFQPDDFALFLIQFAWYWVMYLIDFSLRFESIRKVSLEYVLSVGALLSLVFAFTVYQFYIGDELESKKKFANKLALEKDVLGEFYLNEILTQFRSDVFIQDRMEGGFFAHQSIRETIRRQFVSSYFDKYELEVLLFDSDSTHVDGEQDSYGNYASKYAIDDYSTDYQGIFLVDDTDNIAQKKYACFISYPKAGFITIILNRKKNAPTSVFPELLVESKYEQEGNNEFDYTIFKDSTVLYGQGRFGHINFLESQDLRNESLYDEGISLNGRNFFGLKTNDDRVIVVVSNTYPNRSWVINFSFVFLLFILLISVVGVFYRLVLAYQVLTLANKIQLYLALGFLVPLFITGFTLLNTLNDSYRDEITRSYLKKSLRISENLVEETVQFENNESTIDAFASYVGNVSRFVEADLNIYTPEGQLVTTSQPGIFGLNLLSDKINPVALQALNTDDQNIIVDESIGLLDFKTTYTAISGYSDGRLLGIVALPFFDSKNHLRRQQKEVFADLLMIFALIFLFALISGNYILNYLIGPLKLVSEHIKRTNLDVDNQPIDYTSDDEIGMLVKEYNHMLLKLERNKEALARSQKESAWKEIARQVAHEIKNPLTPMRLKIQQLQRDLIDERQIKLLSSMISQIDTLSDIADSFSEFAKMPAPENTDMDLVEVVAQSVRLYRSKDVTINTYLIDHPIMIWSDPNMLGRIMNNLLLNAIQSVKGKEPDIEVRMRLAERKVEISCKDNGVGIPDDIKEKIFTTYFSTKASGSGIGLAVAKKGIENAGGNIWFESVEGEGTTFYISFPVYEAV